MKKTFIRISDWAYLTHVDQRDVPEIDWQQMMRDGGNGHVAGDDVIWVRVEYDEETNTLR